MDNNNLTFYTNNIQLFYNVHEIKKSMNEKNIYILGTLEEYYNSFLKELISSGLMKGSDNWGEEQLYSHLEKS